MQTSRFKKFLEVVFGHPSLPLEITFGCRYIPHTRVIGFFPTLVVVGHCTPVTRSALLPLVAALSTSSSALVGVFSGCGLTTVRSRSHISEDKSGPNCLLT
jgi:hypothetical protein